MVNCQKYFSIISESSQILGACFRAPTDGQGHIDFPDKEMNGASQLSHFLKAYKKNESQPHCQGEKKRGDVRREVASAAGRMASGTIPWHICVLKTRSDCLPMPCYSPHPEAKMPAIKAQPPKEEQKSRFQCLPFISSVPWQQATTTKCIIKCDNQTGGKGILSPSWAALTWTYPTRQGGTCSSPERVPWRQCTYSFVPHLLNAPCARQCSSPTDTTMNKIPKNPCSDRLCKHSPFLNNSQQQWSLNKWNFNKIIRK